MGTEYDGTHFEWDDEKAEANVVDHEGATFFEAATVFADPLSIIVADNEHSIEEARYLTIGRSYRERILIVSDTERGDAIRIVSARTAEPKETRAYEHGK